MVRDHIIRSKGRPQAHLSTQQCANCGKPCNNNTKHVNIEYGINFFCNDVCKLNWVYVQFKGTKLRGILDFAVGLVK